MTNNSDIVLTHGLHTFSDRLGIDVHLEHSPSCFACRNKNRAIDFRAIPMTISWSPLARVLRPVVARNEMERHATIIATVH